MTTTPCPLCGKRDWRLVLRASDLHYRSLPGTFPLSRCPGCGLFSLQPPPSPDVLRAAYPPAYSPHRAPCAGGSDGPLPRRWRETFLRPGMKVLDVGCGSGRDLDRLKRRGLDVWGVEPDADAADAARQLGLRVHTGTLGDAPHPPPRFDRVSLVHVIEHVPDPVATLRRAGALLSSDGEILLVTPNASAWSFRVFREAWYPLDAPRHVNLFTPGTLREACRRAGLRVRRLRLRPQPRVVRESLARTGRGTLTALSATAPGRAAIRILSAVANAVFRSGEELMLTATRGRRS